MKFSRKTGLVICALVTGTAWSQESTKQVAPTSMPNHVMVAESYIRFMDRVSLAFERPGVLAELSLREGDVIKSGALVARLSDEVARAALAIAEIESATDVKIRIADKESEIAQAEYNGVLRANADTPRTFPEAHVMRLRLDAEKARLLIEQQQHEHQVNQLNRDHAAAELATYSVQAPFDGTVTNIFKRRGEAVQQGENVVELVNTTKVRVDGYIDLANAWRVRPGDAVEVQVIDTERNLPINGRLYAGSIRFVDVSVQTVRKAVRIWAEVENKDGLLLDGLQAQMKVFPRNPAASPAPVEEKKGSH